MFPTQISGLSLRLLYSSSKVASKTPLRLAPRQCQSYQQSRGQHHRPPRRSQNLGQPTRSDISNYPTVNENQNARSRLYNGYTQEPYGFENIQLPRVRYIRPAIWAVVVSGGIFTGLAYFQAKQELKSKVSQGWLEAPKWSMQRRGPPTPTELATQWWAQLNPMSKVSSGIIAANSVVHLSSFIMPRYWDLLWHTPARNVNYTLFSSMFVHSGLLHLFFNMYFTYNFMEPVGYSRAFQGNPYHVLSFFLTAGVLSGYAQHLAVLITPQKRRIPEMFIRCGGASGALLGIFGLFCVEYPTAGIGLMFIPIHFEAQYVLSAVMLFDLIGMVRGYSFLNFGHAAHLFGTTIGVAYSYFDGKNRLWNPLVDFWREVLLQSS
ncbi:hypothetical protein GQ44DRAFT_823904 [Phaeosphaeriaceae sp. PMI808]|nr:hypothetical protein GQ44DRAFT_823904 [Phaeosphaeriaceae sp. PMI808]